MKGICRSDLGIFFYFCSVRILPFLSLLSSFPNLSSFLLSSIHLLFFLFSFHLAYLHSLPERCYQLPFLLPLSLPSASPPFRLFSSPPFISSALFFPRSTSYTSAPPLLGRGYQIFSASPSCTFFFIPPKNGVSVLVLWLRRQKTY